MAISFHRLKYFRAIVSAGSVAGAARQIHVAQPALSHHISELEADLGTKLLVRTNKGVSPTAAGKVLLRYANDILQRIEDAENEVRTLAQEPHGVVTIAVAVTLARHLVPVLLQIVGERCPKVDLRIMDITSTDAIDLMKSEKIELALIPIASEIADVDARSIYREPACFIRLCADRKPNHRPIKFVDVARYPLVQSSRRYNLRQRIEEAAIETGARLDIRYTQDASEIVRSIVLAGLAATITQQSVFHPETERPKLEIRRIVEPQIMRTHSIVRRSDREPSLSISVVETAIIDSMALLVEDGTLPGKLSAEMPAPR